MKKKETYSLLVRVFREEEIKDWVAHVLDLDVVSQGRTQLKAVDMVKEAAKMTIEEDLKLGLDPFDRGDALEKEWEDAMTYLNFKEPSSFGDQNEPFLTSIQVSILK